ncbi:hypothetical protein SDC9_137243 [bioreactor metagenome]|uniref:Uncharacterized protein n=1 Tax=bioreactor metagenome TaxID=1076179 RepID=A0A645DLC5_9ZZZZ
MLYRFSRSPEYNPCCNGRPERYCEPVPVRKLWFSRGTANSNLAQRRKINPYADTKGNHSCQQKRPAEIIKNPVIKSCGQSGKTRSVPKIPKDTSNKQYGRRQKNTPPNLSVFHMSASILSIERSFYCLLHFRCLFFTFPNLSEQNASRY